MKDLKSKIGEFGVRWVPVEGYSRKDGKKVTAHYKKELYRWYHKKAM